MCIPKGIIWGIITSHKAVCPWITRDAINNKLWYHQQNGILFILPLDYPITSGVMRISPTGEDAQTKERAKGGSLDGTTHGRTKKIKLVTTAAKNEIIATFNNEKKMAGKNSYIVAGSMSSSRISRSAIVFLMTVSFVSQVFALVLNDRSYMWLMHIRGRYPLLRSTYQTL